MLLSVTESVPKVLEHLEKIELKVGVVASRSYVTQRQNRQKIVSFSPDLRKETWKSSFQETRTSGTHRHQIQKIRKIVKFLSLLIQKSEIWCLRVRKMYAETQNLIEFVNFLQDGTRRRWIRWKRERRTSESYRYLIRRDKIFLSPLTFKWLGTSV